MKLARAAVPFALAVIPALGAALGACGGSPSADNGEAYFKALPPWPTPQMDMNGPSGAPSMSSLVGSDGKSYSCTVTPYSMTSTPQQYVTFDPNVDVLWPGALIQGKGLISGTLEGLPLTERAPLAVSIPTLLSASNSVTVPMPNESSVEAAIGQLINDAVTQGVMPSSSVSYTQTEAHSADQAALALGVNAMYTGFNLAASLNISMSADLHSVVGYFVQSMFTVTVPEPETPAAFFQGLTQDEINQQVAEGNLGPTNLPVYVASMTYGRIMMFSITSSESASNIEAALNAQFSAGNAGGGVSAAYSSLMANSSTSFKVVTVGGAAADAEKMIATGNPSDFFTSDPPLSTAVPISYVLRNLADNSIAALSNTTSYNVQTCQETSEGPGANFYISDFGSGQVSAFDKTGKSVALTSPIAGLIYPTGVAYDSLDDRLYVVGGGPGCCGGGANPSAVFAYNHDGSSYSLPGGAFAGLTQGQQISYDPKHDRLYVADAYGAEGFTTSGNKVTSYASSGQAEAAVYDPYNDQIYIAESTGKVDVYALGGTPVALPGAFAGLASPQGMAYDSHHDWLWVTQSSGSPPTMAVFDSHGHALASVAETGASAGVLYDGEVDQAYVLDAATSIVDLFNPDGSSAMLPCGAFSSLVHPVGIAYRP